MERLRFKGKSIEKISGLLNISKSAVLRAKRNGWVPKTIQRIRKERGLDRPERPPIVISTAHDLIKLPTKNTFVVAERWKQMKAFYDSGASLNEIARLFKTDASAVLNAKNRGWIPRRLGRHPNKKEIVLVATRNARTGQAPRPYNDQYITERYQEGVSADRVARECQTPMSYVRQLLKRKELMRPPALETSKSRFLNHRELNFIHMRLKLPVDRQKKAVEMYQGGATTRQVARHFRIQTTLVASLLKKFAVEPRLTGKSKLPDSKKLELLQCLKAGLDDNRIAKRFNLTPIMVRYYIRRGRLAWQKRPEFERIMKQLREKGIVT